MTDLSTSLDRIQALAEAATPGKRVRCGITLPGIEVLTMPSKGRLIERICRSDAAHEDDLAAQTVADFDLVAATDPEVMLAFVEAIRHSTASDDLGAACGHLSRVLEERLSDEP